MGQPFAPLKTIEETDRLLEFNSNIFVLKSLGDCHFDRGPAFVVSEPTNRS